MSEIVFITNDDTPDDDALPSYTEPGRILFWYCPIPNEDPEVEIIDYDADKAPFWLSEAGFMDYTLQGIVHLELEGYYVLEGVLGHSWQDYWGEYDERWDFEFCRRASQIEIDTQALL